MTNVKNTILEKIQKGEIKQTSRFYFATKDYFFFVLTAITTVLGMFAVSALVHNIVVDHIRGMRGVPMSFDLLKTVGQSLPYLWIILLVVLAFAAWYNYKNTSRSYKHHNALVISLVLLVSVVGGAVLFVIGEGERIERKAHGYVPMYEEIKEKNKMRKQKLLERLSPRDHKNRIEHLKNLLPEGVRYVELFPKCRKIKYRCESGEDYYIDQYGCGCKIEMK